MSGLPTGADTKRTAGHAGLVPLRADVARCQPRNAVVTDHQAAPGVPVEAGLSAPDSVPAEGQGSSFDPAAGAAVTYRRLDPNRDLAPISELELRALWGDK